jgi:hypothetical protein
VLIAEATICPAPLAEPRPGDLGVPVGGALFGVPVDRAQQRIDVDERLVVHRGQQIDPPTQRHQVLAEHRLQLAGMTEGELPQHCSHRRGCIHAAEECCHAASADHVDVVDAVRTRAHPRDQRGQLGCRVRRPGLDPWRRNVDLLAEQPGQPGLLGQRDHRH